MRYTVEESLEEVRKRTERVRRRRERRRLGFFSFGVCTLLLLLTLNLAASPLTPADGSEASAMGSFLLEAKNGGIVAALILAVLLAVLVTLLFLRKRRSDPPEQAVRKPNEHTDGGKNHE